MTIEKGRFAVILKETGEVSEIKRMEGNSVPNIGHPDLYDVVEVGADVKIGMVLGASAPVIEPNSGGGEQAPASSFQGLDAAALKAFIKEKTGAAPKGNPSLETLVRLAEEANVPPAA